MMAERGMHYSPLSALHGAMGQSVSSVLLYRAWPDLNDVDFNVDFNVRSNVDVRSKSDDEVTTFRS